MKSECIPEKNNYYGFLLLKNEPKEIQNDFHTWAMTAGCYDDYTSDAYVICSDTNCSGHVYKSIHVKRICLPIHNRKKASEWSKWCPIMDLLLSDDTLEPFPRPNKCADSSSGSRCALLKSARSSHAAAYVAPLATWGKKEKLVEQHVCRHRWMRKLPALKGRRLSGNTTTVISRRVNCKNLSGNMLVLFYDDQECFCVFIVPAALPGTLNQLFKRRMCPTSRCWQECVPLQICPRRVRIEGVAGRRSRKACSSSSKCPRSTKQTCVRCDSERCRLWSDAGAQPEESRRRRCRLI